MGEQYILISPSHNISRLRLGGLLRGPTSFDRPSTAKLLGHSQRCTAGIHRRRHINLYRYRYTRLSNMVRRPDITTVGRADSYSFPFRPQPLKGIFLTFKLLLLLLVYLPAWTAEGLIPFLRPRKSWTLQKVLRVRDIFITRYDTHQP